MALYCPHLKAKVEVMYRLVVFRGRIHARRTMSPRAMGRKLMSYMACGERPSTSCAQKEGVSSEKLAEDMQLVVVN